MLIADLTLHILHYTMQLDIIHIPDVSKFPSDMLDLPQVDLGEMGYEVGRWNWLTIASNGGF